ncbi:glycosyl hydrolase family 28-related protein [Pseudoduganella armeniaca]|nr:glycosyl hydrolase family 28-related protein [Pseudoduganella armeniaca]
MKKTVAAAVAATLLLIAGTAAAQGANKGNAVNISNYGVKCDGVTNDTAAINAALTQLSGLKIQFPAGVCLYNGGGILNPATVLEGAGRHGTVIRALSPAASYLFDVYGQGAGIRGFRFEAAVTQTGGSYVWLRGQESFIEEFHMTGDYNGILMTGSVTRIRHGRFQDGAPGAIRIRAEGGDNSQMIDDVLMGAQQPQVSTAGIRVRNSAALIISNTSVIQQGIGLLVDPYTSTNSNPTVTTDAGAVFSLWVHHCFFDNSLNNGIAVVPTGTGSVQRIRFDNVWAGSSGKDGVLVANFGSGSVSGVHFSSPHLVDNKGSGITTGGTVEDIAIDGGEIAQNQYGVYLNPGANGVRITNATIGKGAGMTGNRSVGVVISSGVDYVTLANNDVRGNGSAIANGASGSHQLFRSNFGGIPTVEAP